MVLVAIGAALCVLRAFVPRDALGFLLVSLFFAAPTFMGLGFVLLGGWVGYGLGGALLAVVLLPGLLIVAGRTSHSRTAKW